MDDRNWPSKEDAMADMIPIEDVGISPKEDAMADMIPVEDAGISPTQVAMRATEALCRVTEVMAQMAASMATMTEAVQQLTRRMDQMEGLTYGQAKALSMAIRKRVKVLCDSYGITGTDERRRRKIGELIKLALRNSVGTDRRGMRDLPRCEYQVYLERVAMWDDYDAMREVTGDA